MADVQTEFLALVAKIAGNPPTAIPLNAQCDDFEARSDHITNIIDAVREYIGIAMTDASLNEHGNNIREATAAVELLEDAANEIAGAFIAAGEREADLQQTGRAA
jgi:hypothetical protein